MIKRTLFLVALFWIPAVSSAAGNGAAGILYGHDHAFSFTAAQGWVLDNESGVPQGLHAVFYPVGQTWRDSPVMAYARAYSKDDKADTVEKLVALNIREFRAKGSPNYQGRFEKTLELPGGRKAAIYHYSGDHWGNFEAVGYIDEEKTINFLVFNARSKELFEKSLEKFEQMVKSYIYLGNEPLRRSGPNKGSQ